MAGVCHLLSRPLQTWHEVPGMLRDGRESPGLPLSCCWDWSRAGWGGGSCWDGCTGKEAAFPMQSSYGIFGFPSKSLNPAP